MSDKQKMTYVHGQLPTGEAKAQAGLLTSEQERQIADLQKQNTPGLGLTEETGLGQFVEQLSASSAKKLVDGCGHKYRPVAPAKMIQMPEDFRIRISDTKFLTGKAGDFLGLNHVGALFVVDRDLDETWRLVKR